ncbi:MAG: peptidase [Burkholderiales bacterium]|nr:peptidase [Burkholderiales bacterium]
MKPIHIFRPGRHTPTAGAALSFSEADLAAAAAAYDPAVHEAPIVVGHPRGDAPAYGWVSRLSFAEGDLLAEPSQVDPAFAELVADGRFKKVSASFYTPDSPTNPKPGAYYLRHVGFLGAQPPAIKGLRPVEFGEEPDAGVVEFSDWADQAQAGLWRRMREFLIAQFGLDKAEQVAPAWMVDALQEEAVRESIEKPPAPGTSPALAYAEGGDPVKTKTTEELQAELAAAQAQLAADQAKLAADQAAFAEQQAQGQRAQQRREAEEFAEGLVQAGQLPPAQRDVVVGLLATMPTATVIEFGEGDARTEKSASQVLREFLQALPKAVDFQERAGGRTQELPEGATAQQIRDAAVQFQEVERAAGREISFELAVQRVTAEQAKA